MSDSVILDGDYHIYSKDLVWDVLEPGPTKLVLESISGKDSQKWNIKWDSDESDYRIFNADTLMYLCYDSEAPIVSVGKSTDYLWNIVLEGDSKDQYHISPKLKPDYQVSWVTWPFNRVVTLFAHGESTIWTIEKV